MILILFVCLLILEMSEKKLHGFAAMMKQRKKAKEQEKEEEQSVQPVIKEISLTCMFLYNQLIIIAIEERIKQLEKQMEDSEDDNFVDVDSDSSEESEEENENMKSSRASQKSQKKWEEKQREQRLLEKMKKANAENQQEVSLDATEAYCEACNLKLSGEMNISVEYKLKNDE